MVFNGAYKSEFVPDKHDKFWTSGLLNKRLIVFPDCNNYNFPTSGLFKQITGDDPIRIEFKKENSYSDYLNCKIMFLSNHRPNITGQMSDMRRAIYSEISPIIGEELPPSVYQTQLWNECPSFFYKCVKLYHEMCPEHGSIKLDSPEVLENLVSLNEESYQALVDEFFDLENELGKSLLESEKKFISPVEMHNFLNSKKLNKHEKSVFLAFIKRKHKVERKQVKFKNNKEWRYVS